MSDLNWCPVCDKAIHPCSQSLYCSLECLQHDVIQRNPLSGYNFTEFKDFLPAPMARRPFNNHHKDEEDCHDGEDDRNLRQQSSLISLPTRSSSSDRCSTTHASSSSILTPPRQITKSYPIFTVPRRNRFRTDARK